MIYSVFGVFAYLSDLNSEAPAHQALLQIGHHRESEIGVLSFRTVVSVCLCVLRE